MQTNKQLTPQQRGALRRNSGDTPLANIPEAQRTEWLRREVFSRYLDDGHLRDIAKSLGVARTSLYQAIVKYEPEQWQALQAARALAELDDAEDAMRCADDAVAVSRAREQLKTAQWKLERTCRRLYGTDSKEDVGAKVAITLNLGTDIRTVK